MAHRTCHWQVILAVSEEGEYDAQKRASSVVFPVVPMVHRAGDGEEGCAYKGHESYQNLGYVAACVLQG